VGESPATRQRSFRLSETTLEELGVRARERGESANRLAARLIEEGLRTDRHPLIWFRECAAGRRPALLGTRLDVAQVVAYLRANDHDAVEVATLLDISRHLVHAASDYYGEFSAEIDAWLDAEANFARRVEVPDRSG
jgi:uncharacterized protein (DUF433 family)